MRVQVRVDRLRDRVDVGAATTGELDAFFAETRDLLGVLVDDTALAVTEGATTSDALEEILTMVAKINELVSGISGASREQSLGVHEILSAMDQLDEVTQQNAAMVEEMTAAGRGLRSDSNALSEVMARFGGDRSSASPAARPEPAAVGGRRVVGAAVLEALTAAGVEVPATLMVGVPDHFVEHGTRRRLLEGLGFTPEGIARRILEAVGSAVEAAS